MSSSFIALYRGHTITDAKLVAVSADPGMVADFAKRLLRQPRGDAAAADPVLATIEQGRRQALRLIARERPGDASPEEA